jgi:sulfide:quinone oxidoreductase
MPDTQRPRTFGGLRVVIAGGGVAALEALLALRELAGDLVDLELLAPDPEFWYRPLAVAEPFGAGRAEHFDLASIASSVSAGYTLDRLASVDVETRVARTGHGALLHYDALVLACGALPRPWLANALTFRGPADSDAFRRILAEAESGAVRSIAFVAPAVGGWLLPLYELALLTAGHLTRSRKEVELTLATPERTPLALFGAAASDTVRALLDEHGIKLHTSRTATHYEAGQVELFPGTTIAAERVVTLPRLEGIRILGIPQDPDGFVATDLSGRVLGVPSLYAAGDITQFPVKQGGIAAQQADAAAETIAALAGAGNQPKRFEPVLRGLLLTGGTAQFLRNAPAHAGEAAGTITADALWWPPAKIVGRYLAPYLATHAGVEVDPPEAQEAHEIHVNLTTGQVRDPRS